MSQFTFPRINFNGTATINVGTGNNDDFSNKGLRVSNTKDVQPIFPPGITTDEEFMNWATKIDDFEGGSEQLLPGEWNFFGDMSIKLHDDAKVTGVQTDYGELITEAGTGKSPWINSQVTMFPTILIDVNPEGVPSSQVFCDNFSLTNGSETILSGKPTKASTRFINFFRNTDLSTSTGASATFYSVIHLDEVDSASTLPKNDLTKNIPNLKGFMIRYNFYRFITQIEKYAGPDGIAAHYDGYENKQLKDLLNPKVGLMVGTVSPWLEGEMKSITLGRFLTPQDSFPNPGQNNNPPTGNGKNFVLAPVTAKVSDDNSYVSLDIVNTFPNTYSANTIGMLDLGTVNLNLNDGVGTSPNKIVGTFNYKDYQHYLNSGGLVDFSLASFTKDQINNGSFNITQNNDTVKILMKESDYMITSDQSTCYAEQNGPEGAYNSYGTPEQVTFQAVYKGQPITPTTAKTFNLYEYSVVPNNDPQYTGNSQLVSFPGEEGNPVPVNLKTTDRGCFMYYLSEEETAPANRDLESGFFIDLRVLPTDDYSQYINNPDTLTWEILYEKVLRYYRLIFPAMDKVFPFKEDYWKNSAAMIYERVGLDWWDKVEYMPRTRDLSDSRRKLIQTWLKKHMPSQA